MVEQNAELALQVADRGYVLRTGHIAIAGSAQTLLAHPGVREAYLGRALEDEDPVRLAESITDAAASGAHTHLPPEGNPVT
jgi:branched-chain amino acid transport system ATP-binding protein